MKDVGEEQVREKITQSVVGRYIKLNDDDIDRKAFLFIHEDFFDSEERRWMASVLSVDLQSCKISEPDEEGRFPVKNAAASVCLTIFFSDLSKELGSKYENTDIVIVSFVILFGQSDRFGHKNKIVANDIKEIIRNRSDFDFCPKTKVEFVFSGYEVGHGSEGYIAPIYRDIISEFNGGRSNAYTIMQPEGSADRSWDRFKKTILAARDYVREIAKKKETERNTEGGAAPTIKKARVAAGHDVPPARAPAPPPAGATSNPPRTAQGIASAAKEKAEPADLDALQSELSLVAARPDAPAAVSETDPLSVNEQNGENSVVLCETYHNWVNVTAATCVKPKNDILYTAQGVAARLSDDRMTVSWRGADEGLADDNLLVAVSDGAGSSGIFSGEWAEYLIRYLPSAPLSNLAALESWIEGFCWDFKERYGRLASSDGFKKKRFVSEGSCATLSSAWIAKQEGGGIRADLCVYGDSPAFRFSVQADGVYRLQDVYLPSPPDRRLQGFMRDPHLLNWNANANGLHALFTETELQAGDVLVMCSDGIGQYVLLSYLTSTDVQESSSDLTEQLLDELKDVVDRDPGAFGRLARAYCDRKAAPVWFSDVIKELRRHMVDTGAFSDHMAVLLSEDLIANDDCSLILVDVPFAEGRLG